MRIAVPGMVIGLLAHLAYFKMRGLFDDDAVVPIGVSYFTFKLIHYVIEVGRGTIPAHTPSKLLAYIFFYPIFTAGPIERFERFVQERDERWTVTTLIEGGQRIAIGVVKKFLDRRRRPSANTSVARRSTSSFVRSTRRRLRWSGGFSRCASSTAIWISAGTATSRSA